MKQLTLDVDLPTKPREFHPSCLQVLATARYENEQATAIAREMYGVDVGDLSKLPNEQFIPIWQEFHRRAGTKTQPLRETPETPAKVSRYRPWTTERKQQNRVRKMKDRILKKYSFPNFWIDAMQRKLLDMPQYFGVCPLPQSVDHCQVYLSDLIQNPAKLKEAELREAEYQRYKEHLASQKEAV